MVQRDRHAGLLTPVGLYGDLHHNQYARHANPPGRPATRARSLVRAVGMSEGTLFALPAHPEAPTNSAPSAMRATTTDAKDGRRGV